MSRRTFLKRAGLGALVVGVGGGMWRALDQGLLRLGQGAAFAPWAEWRGAPEEGPLALVRAAILAASPHNTQPWRFAVAADRIDLWVDAARALTHVDPLGRELHLGLGCALENLLQAAAAHGYTPALTLFPDPATPEHVASLGLEPGPRDESVLYRAIPQRHTNRAAYETTRLLPTAFFTSALALGADLPGTEIVWITAADARQRMGELIVRATEATIADHAVAAETFAWTRLTTAEVDARRDGITLEAAGMPLPLLALVHMLPEISQAQNDDGWLTMTRDTQVPTAAAFGIVTVAARDDRAQQVMAGRLWQRLHLSTVGQGIALQPLNQPVERAVQEELAGDAGEFATGLRALVDGDSQPVLVFRAGYPTREVLASPRRPVEAVLLG